VTAVRSGAERAERGRLVRTHPVMGTVASAHVVGPPGSASPSGAGGGPLAVERAIAACFAELDELDRVFSPFRDDSAVSRIRRGELALEDADARVVEVAERCLEAAEATRGRFSAAWRGGFDPTGYVKGWAVERAARRHLAPLLAPDGVAAVALGAGGDVQALTAPGAHWTWRIGIADPRDRSRVLAVVELADGAVATSGTAERGAHVVDPATGRPAAGGLASATVVADGLATADAWATAALVAGFADLFWIAEAPVRSGLLVHDSGAIRRWGGGVEVVSMGERDDPLAAVA